MAREKRRAPTQRGDADVSTRRHGSTVSEANLATDANPDGVKAGGIKNGRVVRPVHTHGQDHTMAPQ
eukprot:4656599-Heterocapsa_arctica.AAC.1